MPSIEEDIKRYFSADRHSLVSGVDPHFCDDLAFVCFPLRQFRL